MNKQLKAYQSKPHQGDIPREEWGTRGHLADHGGLRGHSVGDIYPWRVVGRGDDSWEVVDVTGQPYARFYTDLGNEIAEAVARSCKAEWPDGRIPERTDPCLY